MVTVDLHSVENFGESPLGHILIQDHGNRMAFTDIKIRRFD